MREARRVLKPGGHFLFNVWDRIEDNVFADDVTNALAGAARLAAVAASVTIAGNPYRPDYLGRLGRHASIWHAMSVVREL